MYTKRFRSHHDANRRLKGVFKSNENPYDYLVEKLNQKDDMDRALYIHVPYCKKICSFCPFTKYSKVPKSSYDDLVIKQIDRIKDYQFIQSNPFESIYFGGGTPTALDPIQIQKILKHIHESIPLHEEVEISLETSASEMTDEMLDILKENGVNRLSVGIQTFCDQGRALLNRRGSGDFAASRLQKIKEVIPNTNIDLIYNYPGQDLKHLDEDLETIMKLDIAGLSFYALMIHEGTPLVKKLTQKEINQMSNLTREKEFFYHILDRLGADGYDMFELTKLIKNKRDCYKYIQVKHKGGHCVPIGVKSGGRIGRYSFYNYETDLVINGNLPISKMGQMITKEYLYIEKIINQIQHGDIPFETFNIVSGIIEDDNFKSLVNRYQKEGLINNNHNHMKLTKEGFFFGNNMIDELANILINFQQC